MNKFGNSKKVWAFLNGLNPFERILLGHCVDFSDSVQKLISRGDVTKEEICQAAKIKPAQYKKFVAGGFDYNLYHIVAIEHIWRDRLRSDADKHKVMSVSPAKTQDDKKA
jgi:hypothetical protein